jgi:hypothetical protein
MRSLIEAPYLRPTFHVIGTMRGSARDRSRRPVGAMDLAVLISLVRLFHLTRPMTTVGASLNAGVSTDASAKYGAARHWRPSEYPLISRDHQLRWLAKRLEKPAHR